MNYFFIIIGLAFVIYIIYSVRHNILDEKESFLWLVVAALSIILALNYKIVDIPAQWLGVAYPPALFFLLVILFLVTYLIRLTVKYSGLEVTTRELVEEVALLRAELKQLSESPALGSEKERYNG